MEGRAVDVMGTCPVLKVEQQERLGVAAALTKQRRHAVVVDENGELAGLIGQDFSRSYR